MKKILTILAVVFVIGTASLLLLGRMAEAGCMSEKPQSMQEMCDMESEKGMSMMEMCKMPMKMMDDQMPACCKQHGENDSSQLQPAESPEKGEEDSSR